MKHNLNLHESIQEAISNTLYVHVDRVLSEYIFFSVHVCVFEFYIKKTSKLVPIIPNLSKCEIFYFLFLSRITFRYWIWYIIHYTDDVYGCTACNLSPPSPFLVCLYTLFFQIVKKST